MYMYSMRVTNTHEGYAQPLVLRVCVVNLSEGRTASSEDLLLLYYLLCMLAFIVVKILTQPAKDKNTIFEGRFSIN